MLDTPIQLNTDTPLWTPSRQRVNDALITAFEVWLAREHGLKFDGYESLWQWSVNEPETFWSAILAFFELPFDTPPTRMRSSDQMPDAGWFPGARLNFTQQVRRHRGLGTPALIYDSGSVASALACASSAPSAFHCGQSFWVSDSQAGLGRLPAMVLLNSVLVMASPVARFKLFLECQSTFIGTGGNCVASNS